MLLLALLVVPGAMPSVRAAGFAVTVTTTADTISDCSITGVTPCSLRDAIRYANGRTSADTTTIILPAGIYNLSRIGACEDAALTGDLDITKNVILNGADPATTIIDGVASDRVLDIRVSTTTVSLSNITIRNGLASTSCGSNAGGIAMVGNVTLTNVIVSGNGARANGGIGDTGTLTLINSTVSNNRACRPGGIGMQAGAGTLTLTNSTVSGNIASSTPGGGVDCPGYVSGGAGGIDAGSTVHLTNSTISGNSNTYSTADNAGGIRNSGQLTIAYSTISGNTVGSGSSSAGGILNRTGLSLTMQGSIVAGNTGSNCFNGGTATSQGYNLSDDASCGLTQPTDLPNTNPKLGPLASNGGPTQTHALLPGSPAIDNAPATGAGCPATDQRGVARPVGPACDLGAYEFKQDVVPMPRISGQVSGTPNQLPLAPRPIGSPVTGGPPAPMPTRRT